MIKVFILLFLFSNSQQCLFLHGLGFEDYEKLNDIPSNRIITNPEDATNYSSKPEHRYSSRLRLSQYWGDLPNNLAFCDEKHFADFDTVNLSIAPKKKNEESESLLKKDGVEVLCEFLEMQTEPLNVITHSMGTMILGAALAQCPKNKAKVKFLGAIATPWKGSTSADILYPAKRALCNKCMDCATPIAKRALKFSKKYCGDSYDYVFSDWMSAFYCTSNPIEIRKEAYKHLKEIPVMAQVCAENDDMVIPPESCYENPDAFDLAAYKFKVEEVENIPSFHEAMMWNKQTWEFLNSIEQNSGVKLAHEEAEEKKFK